MYRKLRKTVLPCHGSVYAHWNIPATNAFYNSGLLRIMTSTNNFFSAARILSASFLDHPPPLLSRKKGWGRLSAAKDDGGVGCGITRGIDTAEAVVLSALSGLEVTAAKPR